MLARRKDMKPGTVFGVPSGPAWATLHSAYVVLDDRHEVDFWRGRNSRLGEIAPMQEFEVLS